VWLRRRAVALAPEADRPYYLNTRGLARALRGDYAGAAADFEQFVVWAGEADVAETVIDRRESWIADLRAGRTPFDAETLEELKAESVEFVPSGVEPAPTASSVSASTPVIRVEATVAARATATVAARLAGRSVPDPAECDVEPRSLASVNAFAGTPVAEPSTPSANVPFVLPPGSPASQEIVEAITAATRILLACNNTGDRLRTLALFTDDAIRDYNATVPITDEVLAGWAATLAPYAEPDWIALVAVLDIRVLADGRVGALVEIDIPGAPPTRTEFRFYYFEKENGRYLIDRIVRDLDVQPITPMALPTPTSRPIPSPPPVATPATPQASA
jgi:hypothetical protein